MDYVKVRDTVRTPSEKQDLSFLIAGLEIGAKDHANVG